MTIVIPAYSLQKVPCLLQCNEKSKIYFRKKDWRIQINVWNRMICWIAAGGSDLTGWTVKAGVSWI